MRWFVPCASGDYRLEQRGTTVMLSIERPTPAERKVLSVFLAGYPELSIGRLTAKTLLTVALPEGTDMGMAASRLVELAYGNAPKWTAVRMTGGQMTLSEGVVAPAANAEAAVTIRKPARGCPAPEPCTPRASEVLDTFLTPRQRQDWSAHGYFRARGSATGRLYTVFHRNEAARRGYDHSLMGPDGQLLCAWMLCVPAEEEALGLKLAIEHREREFV